MKRALPLFLCLLLCLSACQHADTPDTSPPPTSPPTATPPAETDDAGYEAQTIRVEGLSGQSDEVLSVEALRALPQHTLDAAYTLSDGREVTASLTGCYVSDVIAHLGGSLDDCAGLLAVGRDGYNCLLTAEALAATPDLMLALSTDGQTELGEDLGPAQLAAPGQPGFCWVPQVERLVLYAALPESVVATIWVFGALTDGLPAYEPDGSGDSAFALEEILSRFGGTDGGALLTLRSADGLTKRGALDLASAPYAIKITGADAPSNAAPNIPVGMDVPRLAWFSTGTDAAVFPAAFLTCLETREVGGETGVPLDAALAEAGAVLEGRFELVATDDARCVVSADALALATLVPTEDNRAKVVWEPGAGYGDIGDLLCVRATDAAAETPPPGPPASTPAPSAPPAFTEQTEDTILTIEGDGVAYPTYYSLADLQAMTEGYAEQVFSEVSNWPTQKLAAARGVRLDWLLGRAGLLDEAASIRVAGADGYACAFTRAQLLGAQYCYSAIHDESAEGAAVVYPLLAWAYAGDTDNPAAAAALDGLRLLLGQDGVHQVNTAASVPDVVTVTVTLAGAGQWEAPRFSAAGGLVSIHGDDMDHVKIYYTTDGSDPSPLASVYNPSTSTLQPELIAPFEAEPGMVVKAYAVGYGRYDSEVAAFTYEP